MHRGFVALLALAAGSAPAFAQPEPPPGPYNGQSLVTVTPRDAAQLPELFDHVTAVWNCVIGPGPLDVQVTPAQLQWLRDAGYEPRTKIADVQAAIDAELAQIAASHVANDDAWYGTFRTLAEMHARLDTLAANSAGVASTVIVGTSLENRQIKGIRMSGPDRPGSPRASRPSVMFQGCQHAREWITPMTNMYIAEVLLERYAAGDARVRTLLDNAEVIVVPVVNPDGYTFSWTSGNRLWRKNRRPNAGGSFGVDLNRNWGYQWGGEGAGTTANSETYRGTAAFSEPETQALRDFVNANPRIKAHIDFHSYGQLILSPWGYAATLPADSMLFDEINDSLEAGIEGVYGMPYNAGPTYTTIYPAAGVSQDWLYGVKGILAWGIEERDTGQNGFVLPAAQILPSAQEQLEGALRLAERVLDPIIISPNITPLSVDAVTGAAAEFTFIDAGSTRVGAPTLWTRVNTGEPFAPTTMTLVSGTRFRGQLPAASCPSSVEYYVTASAADGRVARYPRAGDQTLSSFGATQVISLFSDDMETNRGWTVGAPGDNATGGVWERGVPQATTAQPGADYSPAGTQCWMTGLAAGASVGANDLDGGYTTLTSPRFSALPTTFTNILETRITYARWYSNDRGSAPNADSMTVLLSNNDGATWTAIEGVSENLNAWSLKSFRMEDILAPTSQMRLRFVASDLNAGSVVEAGVDDVFIYAVSCAPNLDLNGDGNADQQDVDYLINVISGGDNPNSIDPDFNHDGNADQADIDDLIRALAGG